MYGWGFSAGTEVVLVPAPPDFTVVAESALATQGHAHTDGADTTDVTDRSGLLTTGQRVLRFQGVVDSAAAECRTGDARLCPARPVFEVVSTMRSMEKVVY